MNAHLTRRDFAAVLLALDTAMGVSGALPPYFSVLLARKR